MTVRSAIKRFKPSRKPKIIGKVSAFHFGGEANYDFHQFHTNSEEQNHEDERCDSETIGLTNNIIFDRNPSPKNDDKIIQHSSAFNSEPAIMISDNTRRPKTSSAPEPSEQTKENVKSDREVSSMNYTSSLRRMEKNLKEDQKKSQGEMNPDCAHTLVQMGHAFLSRSLGPDNADAAKDARRAKACFMVASKVYRLNDMQKEKQESLHNRDKAREVELEFTGYSKEIQNEANEPNIIEADASKFATDTRANASDFWSRICSCVESWMGNETLADNSSHQWDCEGDSYYAHTMDSSGSYTDATEYTFSQSRDDCSLISQRSRSTIKWVSSEDLHRLSEIFLQM